MLKTNCSHLGIVPTIQGDYLQRHASVSQNSKNGHKRYTYKYKKACFGRMHKTKESEIENFC